MVSPGTLLDAAASALGGADTSGRPVFDITIGPVAGALRVVSFSGHERLSKLFSYEVVVLAPAEMDLVEAGLLGLPGALTIMVPDGEPRIAMGIVAAVEPESSTVYQGRHAYRLRIAPRFWLLKKRITSRIFQNMTVPDIAAAVLGQAEIANRSSLTHSYPKREYCVQYQESDYAFVKRILAEEGIMWYFEPPSGGLDALTGGASTAVAQTAGAVGSAIGGPVGGAINDAESALGITETLVLIDDPSGYPPMAGGDPVGVEVDASVSIGPDGVSASASASLGTSPHLVLRVGAGKTVSDDDVEGFGLRQAVASNTVLLRDYDFQRPLLDLRAQVKADSSISASASIGSGGDIGSALGNAAKSAATSAVNSAASALTGVLTGDLQVYEHRGDYGTPEVNDDRATVVLEEYRRRATIGGGTSACRRMSAGFRFALDSEAFPVLAKEYLITEVRHEGHAPEHTTLSAHAGHHQVYRNTFSCAPADVPFRPKRPKKKFRQVLESAVVVGPPGEDIFTDEYGRIKVQFPWDLDGKNDGYSSCWMRVMQAWGGAAWGTQFIPRVGMEVMVGFLSGDQDCPVILGSVYNATHPPSFPLPADRTRSGLRTCSSPGGEGYNELSFEDSAGKEQVYLHAQRDLEEVVLNDRKLRVGANQDIGVGDNRAVTVGGNALEKVFGDCAIDIDGNRTLKIGGAIVSEVTHDITTHTQQSHTLKAAISSNVVVGTKEAEGTATLDVYGDAAASATRTLQFTAVKSIRLVCGKSTIEITPDEIKLDAKALTLSGSSSVSVVGKGPALHLTDEAQLSAGKGITVKTPQSQVKLDQDTTIKGSTIKLNCDEPEKDDDDAPTPPTPKNFQIVLADAYHEPYASKDYRLVVEGQVFEGTTGGDGSVKEDVSPTALSGELTLWLQKKGEDPKISFPLILADLPPLDTPLGVRTRLKNLGYLRAGASRGGGDVDAEAIKAFQADQGLEPTGELDGDTKSKLQDLHGT